MSAIFRTMMSNNRAFATFMSFSFMQSRNLLEQWYHYANHNTTEEFLSWWRVCKRTWNYLTFIHVSAIAWRKIRSLEQKNSPTPGFVRNPTRLGFSRGCFANKRVAERSATRWRRHEGDRAISRRLFLHNDIRRVFAAAAGVEARS